jgi:hypothetical protein
VTSSHPVNSTLKHFATQQLPPQYFSKKNRKMPLLRAKSLKKRDI